MSDIYFEEVEGQRQLKKMEKKNIMSVVIYTAIKKLFKLNNYEIIKIHYIILSVNIYTIIDLFCRHEFLREIKGETRDGDVMRSRFQSKHINDSIFI